MKNFIFIVLLFFSFVISGCSYDSEEEYFEFTDVNVTSIYYNEAFINEHFYSSSIYDHMSDDEKNRSFVLVVSFVSKSNIFDVSGYIRVPTNSVSLKTKSYTFTLGNAIYPPSKYENGLYYYEMYIQSTALSSNGYLDNVEDLYFQIDCHYEANPTYPTSYTYKSNKVVIKASDIKNALNNIGAVYQ